MIKLKALNYSIWNTRIDDILYCKELFELIECRGYKPVTTTEDEWKKLIRKTIEQIRQWVDQRVFHYVAKEVNAYSIWQKLESLYEIKTVQNKVFMIRRLVNLKYKDGNSISEHFGNVQGLLNELSTMKLELDDEV